VKERLVRVAKLLAFPAFYAFSLMLFGYLTFPYGRLKDRIIAEVEKRGKPGQRVEIGKLTSYWLSGVELTNVKLHLPPEEAAPATGFPGAADFTAPAPPAKESVITIDEAHARVRLLPLLLGRVRLDFWASAFGGEIKGSAPLGTAKGEIEVDLDHVDISKIEPIGQAIGIPIKGVATGQLLLDASDGKLAKASGTFDLTLADVVVSDGKTKIQGLLELPPAKLGDLVITAEAKEGALKITKLSANGTDLEIVGDGKISLREPWNEAIADLYLRFKFTDAYRGKNATTKSLLGEPGSTAPSTMETLVPKMKRAKRPDGFYGWHISGPLKRLRYDPSTTDYTGGAPTTATTTKRPFGKAIEAPVAAPRRALPIGGGLGRDNSEPLAPAVPAPTPHTPPPPAVTATATEAPHAPEPLRVPAAPVLPVAPPPPPPPPPPAPESPPPEAPPPEAPPP
jgi:type II secretion system protein N